MRASLLIALLLPLTAEAQFLPGSARAIPQSDSASRDAPVFEMAYGPKPQTSLGGELGLYRRQGKTIDFRLSAYTLAAFENGRSQLPPATEFGRLLFGVTTSFALTPPVGTLELSVGGGRHQAFQTNAVISEANQSGDIPFGGGGTFLSLEAAWRASFGSLELSTRLSGRLHLPLLVGIFSRVGSEAFADGTGDGLADEPALDAVLRWKPTERIQPLISLHAGLLVPNDPFTRMGYFARALLALAFPGTHGELLPFLSADVGNGLGLLINRHELRFSVGVRYAAM